MFLVPRIATATCTAGLLIASILFKMTATNAQTHISPIQIRVAIVGPLTPSSKAFGISHLQGITLAAKEYNQQHSLDGRSIVLEIHDDEALPEKGASLIETISRTDAVAVLGPANSAVAKSVIDKVSTARLSIPVVSSLATASNLTKASPPTFFRANVSDQKRLSALLKLIFNDDATRPRRLIAFYERADAFGEGMLNDAKNWLSANYSDFLNQNFLELPYPRNIKEADASQLVADVASRGYGAPTDAIILLGIAQDATTFVQAIRNKSISSRIYFNEPDTLIFKAAANAGVPIAGIHVLSVYWPQNATVNAFKPAFEAAFNDEPSFSAALSYDAARLLFRAIDVALSTTLPAIDIEKFRKLVSTALQANTGETIEFAVEGDHQFINGEYRRLEFQGLQYNSRGDLIQWSETPFPSPTVTLGTVKAVVLPTSINLMCVVFFGFFGSVFREFIRIPRSTFRDFLRHCAGPMSLIIDPAISLIVFGCLFLLTILTKRSLLEIGSDAELIYNVGSIAFGFVAGFLGIRALFAIIKRLGISVSEKDLIGPPNASEKPQV